MLFIFIFIDNRGVFGGRDGGMLVVVVFMSVTSVLICRRILPRFFSGESSSHSVIIVVY